MEAKVGSSWRICRDHDGEKLDWTVTYQADTIRGLLAGFASMIWSTDSEAASLGLLDLNFLSCLWSTVPSSSEQWIFLFASAMLSYSSNSLIISSQIKQYCVFINAAFKSLMELSNAQTVNTPTTTILPTVGGTFQRLERLWQPTYGKKHLTHPSIFILAGKTNEIKTKWTQYL